MRSLTAGRLNRHSWDYAQNWLMTSHETSLADQGKQGNQFSASLDDYLVDSPHAADNGDDYRSLAVLRMQRKEYESKCFQGESGDRNMRVGQWRRIDGHPEIDSHPAEQREFVCTELRVEAENNLPTTLDERVGRLFSMNRWSSDRAALAQASVERGVRYTNRFTCVPSLIRCHPFADDSLNHCLRSGVHYKPLVNQRYRITLDDGDVIEGRTGADGMKQDFKSGVPFDGYMIEAIDD